MSWCVRAVALALFLGLASAAPGRIRDEDKYRRMEKWVTDSGGVVKVYVGINKQGHRSIFAREAIKEGDPIMTISGATLINVGSTKGSFLMPSLSVLREQMQPNSRFRPYLDILPPKEELMNACNIDKSLFPLIESEYWVWFIESWQDFLQHALDGKVNSELELTIPEMLGNVTKTLTINHLKEACAVSSTRYVATAIRDRMLLIPFYDLANHERICPHYLTPYDTDFISFIAGKNVAKDEEICNSYGSDLRDDYVLLHYGFLQPIEDPPRLLLIDHHQFDSQQHRQYITEETFEREDKEGLEWEQGRLKHIQGVLKQFDEDAKTNKTRPARGASPITDMLLELQGRRRTAVDYHLKRIEKLLAKQAEL